MKVYKKWWIITGLPFCVVLLTFMGTPHTIFDPLLYWKICLNLFYGFIIWSFYYAVILRLDRIMPWEAVKKLRRWLIQLTATIPLAVVFNWQMAELESRILGWPFSYHLFFYTDVPIFIVLSVGVHFLYQQTYLSARKQLAQEKSLKPMEPQQGKVQSATIMVRKVKKTYVIPVNDIAYFYRKSELNFLRKWDAEEIMMDQSLATVEESLDPNVFFRINRQLLVNRGAITAYTVLPNRHTELQLTPPLGEPALLNKNRVAEFRQWFKSP